MSKVDNYIVLPHLDDEGLFDKLNEATRREDKERGQEFVRVQEECGGSKYLELEIWNMAGNYFDLEQMLKAIRSINWTVPEELILMHGGPDDYAWTTISVWKKEANNE